MAYEPKAEMLQELKLLTGASDEKNDALMLTLKIMGTKVLNEINQEYMPLALEPIIVEMAADSFRLQEQATGGDGVGEIAGTISQVSDNGQSVSYRDSSYQAVLTAVSKTLRDYTAQLDRFRKTK